MIETYVIFIAIVLFIIMPVVFIFEDKALKRNSFDRHVNDALQLANPR